MKSTTLLTLFFCLSITFIYAQTQVGQDIDGEALNDYSGYSVATAADGKTIAIGAHSADGPGGADAGHVRVYEFDASNNWVQKGQDIDGISGNNWAGTSVAISDDGNVVAVGEQYNSNAGIGASGLTRIFSFQNGSWVQLGQNIYGQTAFEYSGYSCALSADGLTVIIGALYGDGQFVDSGIARVFQFDGFSWFQKGSDIEGEAMGDRFGCSVSISDDGNTVLIGGYLNDGAATDAGHVRVFEYIGVNWVQKGNDIDGPNAGAYFGYSVDISGDGNTVIIGGSYYQPTPVFQDTEKGLVQVYEYNGSNWLQKGQDLVGSMGFDWFGHSVSITPDASIIAVGAPRNDGVGNSNSNGGLVTMYYYDGTNWVQLGQDILGEAPNDWFGYAVSLSADGNTLAAGGINNSAYRGHVRVYKLCPIDFAGSRQLTGVENGLAKYETDGIIESIQEIASGSNIEYDSKTHIDLLPGFDILLSANFHAFIDGCGGL